jgi:hypothetical protein
MILEFSTSLKENKTKGYCMARPWALAQTTAQPAQPGTESEIHHNRPKRKKKKKEKKEVLH